jgi:AcrR family transcriptional regulator
MGAHMAKVREEIRDSILKAASPFFSRYGLFKATMEEIARSLNMGKSSMYYYFKSKEEIFKAVIDKEVEIIRGKIEAAVAAESTPQGKLRAFAVARMQHLKEMVNVFTALKDEYLKNYSFIQKIRENYDELEVQRVKKILAEGIKAGVFKVDDLDLTARTIMTALRGLEYEWFIKGVEVDVKRNVDKLFTMLFEGIKNRK